MQRFRMTGSFEFYPGGGSHSIEFARDELLLMQDIKMKIRLGPSRDSTGALIWPHDVRVKLSGFDVTQPLLQEMKSSLDIYPTKLIQSKYREEVLKVENALDTAGSPPDTDRLLQSIGDRTKDGTGQFHYLSLPWRGALLPEVSISRLLAMDAIASKLGAALHEMETLEIAFEHPEIPGPTSSGMKSANLASAISYDLMVEQSSANTKELEDILRRIKALSRLIDSQRLVYLDDIKDSIAATDRELASAKASIEQELLALKQAVGRL